MAATTPKERLEELFESPELFPYAIDWSKLRVKFALMEEVENSYACTPFHFPRYLETGKLRLFECDLDVIFKLRASIRRPPARLALIFHMTAGGSTLLCRCLEAITGTLVIKEPPSLTGTIDRILFGDETNKKLTDNTLTVLLELFSRRYHEAGTAVLKPMYYANFAMPALLQRANNPSSVYIYQDLESWILSMLRRGATGWQDLSRTMIKYYRTMTFPDPYLDETKILEIDPSKLSNTDAIGLFWLLNYGTYLHGLTQRRDRRLRAIRTQDFMRQPLDALRKLVGHFEISADESDLEMIVASDIFRTNAKSTKKAFDWGQREAEMDSLRKVHADDVRLTTKFLQTLLRQPVSFERWENDLFTS